MLFKMVIKYGTNSLNSGFEIKDKLLGKVLVVEKLISVIIPAYNLEKYFGKCIQSVINQSYKNLEIVLVNDGSTDSSFDICKRFSKMDSRIVLLNKENGGLSSARNYGIDNASGEYISFLDSDDFINEDMYETLVYNLEKFNCDISIVESHDIYEDNYFIKKQASEEKIIVYSKQEAMAKYFEGNFIPAWGKLYRKEIFKNIRFPLGVLNEDEAIMIRVFDSCERNIVYQDIKLYFYLKRESGSITSTKNNIKNNVDWVNNAYANLVYISSNHANLLSKAKARYYTSIVAMLIRLVDLDSVEFNDEMKRYNDLLKINKKEILKNKDINLSFKVKCYIMIFNIKVYKFIRRFNKRK